MSGRILMSKQPQSKLKKPNQYISYLYLNNFLPFREGQPTVVDTPIFPAPYLILSDDERFRGFKNWDKMDHESEQVDLEQCVFSYLFVLSQYFFPTFSTFHNLLLSHWTIGSQTIRLQLAFRFFQYFFFVSWLRRFKFRTFNVFNFFITSKLIRSFSIPTLILFFFTKPSDFWKHFSSKRHFLLEASDMFSFFKA